jgi:hypothetical protein
VSIEATQVGGHTLGRAAELFAEARVESMSGDPRRGETPRRNAIVGLYVGVRFGGRMFSAR